MKTKVSGDAASPSKLIAAGSIVVLWAAYWPAGAAQIVNAQSGDLHSVGIPRTDEVKYWSKDIQPDLQELPRISFRQLCFSFASKGKRAHHVAVRAFQKVAGQPVDFDAGIANRADHLMLQSYYSDQTSEEVSKVFGATFARSLYQLKSGGWQGPIESPYGWHLVWIDSITTSRGPTFH